MPLIALMAVLGLKESLACRSFRVGCGLEAPWLPCAASVDVRGQECNTNTTYTHQNGGFIPLIWALITDRFVISILIFLYGNL